MCQKIGMTKTLSYRNNHKLYILYYHNNDKYGSLKQHMSLKMCQYKDYVLF